MFVVKSLRHLTVYHTPKFNQRCMTTLFQTITNQDFFCRLSSTTTSQTTLKNPIYIGTLTPKIRAVKVFSLSTSLLGIVAQVIPRCQKLTKKFLRLIYRQFERNENAQVIALVIGDSQISFQDIIRNHFITYIIRNGFHKNVFSFPLNCLNCVSLNGHVSIKFFFSQS